MFLLWPRRTWGNWEGDYRDGKEGRKLNAVLHPELLQACEYTLKVMDIRQHSLQSI